jgi:maltose phosphorylase
MKDYIVHHEWKIIEEGLETSLNRISESIFSIGNGRMGQRGNFEESYSGDSLRGSYIAGVYYPDKTRVGWWKNGYPEYFAKIINSINWIGINIRVNGIELDLAKVKVLSFKRELDMQHGLLSRQFIVEFPNGNQVKVNTQRFVSIHDTEIGAIRYSVKAINFAGEISISPYLNGDVFNEDSNYDEKFWVAVSEKSFKEEGYIEVETLKTKFTVCAGMSSKVNVDSKKEISCGRSHSSHMYVEASFNTSIGKGDKVIIDKFVSVVSSLNYQPGELMTKAKKAIGRAKSAGFEKLFIKPSGLKNGRQAI